MTRQKMKCKFMLAIESEEFKSIITFQGSLDVVLRVERADLRTHDGGKRDENNLGEKPSILGGEEGVGNGSKQFVGVTSSNNEEGIHEVVLEVEARFANHLFSIVRKWTSSSKLVKEEFTSVPMWIKFHGVLVLVFTADGLSVIVTRLGTPIMLDSCTRSTCLQSLRIMDYACVLIDIKACRILKDTLKKTTSTPVSNSFFDIEKDNEKPMDDLVDDTRKKMEAPPKKTPRKTSIWLDRKADSPKRNVVFSFEAHVHYFDRDDMDLDDMRHAVEEMEHRNAYSENS
nr:hypothetical protein [Tanacetum cinerariifolium]